MTVCFSESLSFYFCFLGLWDLMGSSWLSLVLPERGKAFPWAGQCLSGGTPRRSGEKQRGFPGGFCCSWVSSARFADLSCVFQQKGECQVGKAGECSDDCSTGTTLTPPRCGGGGGCLMLSEELPLGGGRSWRGPIPGSLFSSLTDVR